MDDSTDLEITRRWMKEHADGTIGHEIEASITKGVRVVKELKGFLLCELVIHNGLSDENENWHVGAIATLVDIIGNLAAYSLTPYQVTVDFSISYLSTAKVQEEVEVEAKVIGKKDNMTSVIVQVRKKENAVMVALGKLWFSEVKMKWVQGLEHTPGQMEEPSDLKVILQWIKDIEDGTISHEVEASVTKGLRIAKAHKGFLLCDFIIHNGLSDENGNWHVGAIATSVDFIASCAAYSFTSCHQVTVDFSISYYSTAKVQEEVEVEAKAIGKKDDLTSVIVGVRKKENGELVALGKLWTSAVRRNAIHQESKL
ncbi:hypothetical protein RIF29_28818 [Crotalaria pallida]|uniref:Acyl-coenzyme A thioesterase 13 n=1 Tax=Crotalaria pallida TaxID=3830 RepID=A0AAN9EEB5_CROPI